MHHMYRKGVCPKSMSDFLVIAKIIALQFFTEILFRIFILIIYWHTFKRVICIGECREETFGVQVHWEKSVENLSFSKNGRFSQNVNILLKFAEKFQQIWVKNSHFEKKNPKFLEKKTKFSQDFCHCRFMFISHKSLQGMHFNENWWKPLRLCTGSLQINLIYRGLNIYVQHISSNVYPHPQAESIFKFKEK